MIDILEGKIKSLHGPILILGASGFIGANLFRMVMKYRSDVYGTASQLPAWRIDSLPNNNIIISDLLVESNIEEILEKVKPLTVFNCVAYGAYSFENETRLIYKTNINFIAMLLELLSKRDIRSYIHAGTSSEYGTNSAQPSEKCFPLPNSHYSVSKLAAANLIYYLGKQQNFPCMNLRFYSVYGPFEDSARLIPSLIISGLDGKFPPFVNPDTSRDFIYIDDACEAFIDAANNISQIHYGESFNIGSGQCTTIGDIANISKELFDISEEPSFSMKGRAWDLPGWFSNPQKANEVIQWKVKTSFEDGLKLTTDWIKSLTDVQVYIESSKKYMLNTKYSVSCVIACYKDSQAIPIMYERLKNIFRNIAIDYEIIFVNDGSPDNTEEVIRKISRRDRRVIGITHSRNFGSQAAFKSGLEIASKNASILLDGDLQDTPELIEKFVEKWREGYDVVYGRRVKRDAPMIMQLAYKLFYRVFDKFSYITIPHDAGDFSLMDKRVVTSILKFPERDLFIRGIRAFAGFKQIGVDYIRPKRMFGISTNNIFKNIGWAKKGLLSFSYTPLNILTTIGVGLFSISLLLIVFQIILKLLFPGISPEGITTVMLLILFFGSSTILAISLVGEYVAKIFEEVKRRPIYIRKSIIRDGEIRNTIDEQIYKDEGKSYN